MSPSSVTRLEQTSTPDPAGTPLSAPLAPASPGPSSISSPSSKPAAPTFGAAAPDVSIPLRFMLAGLISLFLGVGLLVVHPDLLTQYHYHQHVVALTHLLVLGFLLSVAIGALYQLVPVVLETRLHGERLARWHFPIHVISVAGMVWAFWISDMKNVGHFASGLALGVGFFLWNMARTLLRAPRWTTVSTGIAAALFWLATTVAAGLAIAAAKSSYELVGRPDLNPALSVALNALKATADFLSRFEAMGVMHAHAHLGLVGIFVLLTVAVAYKLVPMFLVGDVASPARARASLILAHLGLAVTFFGVLLQNPLKLAGALLLSAGLALYAGELAAIVRQRRRRDLDWGLRGFLVSQALLLPTATLGLALAWPGLKLTEFTGRLENLYGFMAIFGVLAFAILGMLYKILPFLVWFAVYSREIGRARTPSLHDMYSAPWQRLGFLLWIAGLLVSIAGILNASPVLARAGMALLAASLVTFARNTIAVLDHLRRPRLKPFPARRSAAGSPAVPTS